MKQHKWHKEIIAWANGAEIQHNNLKGDWIDVKTPAWSQGLEFRIKPQPKETQYLYVYFDTYVNRVAFTTEENSTIKTYRFLGKLKLEVGDEPVHST